jgi:hypothetical protein
MVRGAGFEPAKASFTTLPANGANGVSLPFIARRITNKSLYLQVFYGKYWRLRAKKPVQILCKNLTCAKTVQSNVTPKFVQILCKLFAAILCSFKNLNRG